MLESEFQNQVEKFFERTQKDLSEAFRMCAAETRFEQALKEYEKLFNVKLEVKQCQNQS